MDTPMVSVILPVYNVERYLRQCMDSILSQTLTDFELICVNDGSTDQSRTILAEYEQRDRRVMILDQKNHGLGAARNRGLALPRGTYVIFLDSDDFFAPELLERTTLAAQEQNADIVLFGGVRYNDATQKVTQERQFLRRDLLPRKPVFSRADVPNTLFSISSPTVWSKLYARQFLLETGLQFQTLPNAEDIYFTFGSMALAERITAVDADLVSYRVNRPDSLEQDKHTSPLCFLEALSALHQEMLRRGLFELLQTSFRAFGLSTTLYNLKSVRTDEARLQILAALDSEPYCQLPLQEVPGIDDGNTMVHRYSLQLSAARDWYHQSERFSLLPSPQDDGEQYRITPPTERKNIQVSVVIPVYNTAPWLDEALSSITNQTLREIEIICIDDGSTDESLEILERWAARDSRFVLFSRPNAGLSCARNLGIAQARGEFLYFMDSDDWLEQDALEQSVAVMREKTLDVLFFDWVTFYDSEEMAVVSPRAQIIDTRSHAYDDVCEGQTLLRRFCEENSYSAVVWRQILRTDFVRENALSFLPGILWEDNPFTFAALLKAKRSFHLRQTYYHYRIRESSITTKTMTFHKVYSHYRSFLDMFRIYFEAAPDLMPENRSAALGRVAIILNRSRFQYSKILPEYEFSELGLRENLYTFQVLVSNFVRESQRAKELNEKLRKANADKSDLNQKLRKANTEKSELNQKLKKTYDEKYDRGV
ncbi:MAG: glycosyltransferase, partial [Clostridiales bacterium]|nr:glycosyltransferase [Clostridiales bacterium]